MQELNQVYKHLNNRRPNGVFKIGEAQEKLTFDTNNRNVFFVFVFAVERKKIIWLCEDIKYTY
jgi:hypothetical protein